ncbi:MAG TPA: SMC-Scp complex subunit ScpB [Arenicellales bacterium]|nr:SMC-Scp complex subunit ScpB [Arenicellales bacterium]
MTEQHSELKNIVEAALLAAEEPLSVSALSSLFPEEAKPSPAQLKEVFEQLDRDYEGRGVELRRVGKGYRFQTREKYSPWLRKLSESRPPRYSRAFLETLAIIAYRQPVTRGDIEEIRGVTVSSDIMRQLLDRDWVKEVGHRDVPGRPALLGTTQQFLEYFNLEALSDLPPLLERRDATEIARELNLRLPLEDRQAAAQDEAGNDGEQAVEPSAEADQAEQSEQAAHDEVNEESTQPADEADAGGEPQTREEADTDAEPAPEDETDTRPTAEVIPIGGALPSKEGDGEDS